MITWRIKESLLVVDSYLATNMLITVVTKRQRIEEGVSKPMKANTN
jgi:hypothetical protein